MTTEQTAPAARLEAALTAARAALDSAQTAETAAGVWADTHRQAAEARTDAGPGDIDDMEYAARLYDDPQYAAAMEATAPAHDAVWVLRRLVERLEAAR